MGYNLHWAAEQKYTTRSSVNQIRHLNNLIAGMKSDGDWSNFDCFWMFAVEATDQATWNFVSPGTFDCTLVNAPTFTAKQGYAGNGSSMYIGSGWDVGTNANKFTVDTASFGVYARTAGSGGTNDMGAVTAESARFAGTAMLNTYTDGRAYCSINDNGTAASDAAGPGRTGFLSMNRTTSTAYVFKRNGTDVYSSTKASTTNTTDFHVMRTNGATNQYYSNKQYSMAFIGAGTLNHANLNTRVTNYLTDIGAI